MGGEKGDREKEKGRRERQEKAEMFELKRAGNGEIE